jgi:hypothetical protein
MIFHLVQVVYRPFFIVEPFVILTPFEGEQEVVFFQESQLLARYLGFITVAYGN